MTAVQAGSIFSVAGPLQSSRSPAWAEPGTMHKIMNAAGNIRRTNGINMTGGSFETNTGLREATRANKALQPGRADCHSPLAFQTGECAPRRALHPTETSVK